jgi:biopolymer transport protein ExbD
MRLVEIKAPRRGIGLTPLIDVVFLLLVFFMLATTFLKFSKVKIETAAAGAGAIVAKELVLVHLSQTDTLTINGRPTPREQVTAELDRLYGLGARHGVLVVRKGSDVGHMLRALALVRQSRLESFRIVR